MKTLFEHVVEQYPPEIRMNKYTYWSRLRSANADYRATHSNKDTEEEKLAFQKWMLDQWGLRVGIELEGYSPYFEILDEKKYMLFLLKYAT